MHAQLKQYVVLVDFLGKVLGNDYEIVLHELSGEENSIVAIANGQISGRSIGAPLTNVALRFLADKEYEQHDYKVGYRGLSKAQASLRSSTMFLKDTQNELIGMLCINYDPSRCTQAANQVLALCGLSPLEGAASAPDDANVSGTENFVGSVPDAVHGAIAEVTGTDLPGSRLTMEEKVRIVGALNRSGLFYLKGAVSEVARQLGSSEASIYRYLSKLKS